MVERRKPIPIHEAVQRIMAYPLKEKVESVPILESYERVLMKDLRATHSVPSFNRSPYDGYAIRSIDTATASRDTPALFTVIGEIGAGQVFKEEVGPNEAVRIMTGAMIPSGCDAVIMLELVHERSKTEIEIVRKVEQHDNISFIGEDTKELDLIAKAGTVIHPGVVAQLATFGQAEVSVASRPVVGILATGSELLEVNEPLEAGKIRNSNAYMVAAQVLRAGGVPLMLGQVPDEMDACMERIHNHFNEVDCLITTGGASVGDFDLVPGIVKRLEAETLFNKVAMRPGSVTTAAVKDGKLFFGLSGNPGACFVGFELFVRPLLRRSMRAPAHLPISKGKLGVDFPKPNPFTRLVRGKLNEQSGQHIVYPSGLDKSGSVVSLAEADVLILLPGGTRGYEKGADVDILLLNSHAGSDATWETFFSL
ncbi:molybdopterin molybdotransferase MoeA [Shouchella lehensis]|uniref:Molybdopterin molybdenumtransferase n=1 Tax=Shouchella lehensis G1 TaxID=1246626 RepID=A0A060M6H9_9BACI|nr:gephyrin-like molybdotransferase Glp [Shouchella lehensis]AIC95699.1 Molybdopterin molybdenumtransferase [Shouchella lehensis G1]